MRTFFVFLLLSFVVLTAQAQDGAPPIGPNPTSPTVGGGPFSSGNVVTGNGGSTVHDSGTALSSLPGLSSSNTFSADQLFASGRPWVDVLAKGAKGDGQVVHDGVTNGSTTLTSASALFAAGDVGKAVICVGCKTGANLVTTIASFGSSSSVTLSASPTLTLPININCTGCAATPYGYATVNSSGAVTGGVVTTNGTSGAASCTAVILTQQGQAGSGGTLNCGVSGGVVNSLTVNAAGSGYLATIYWGTDDSTAIASAMTAASNVNGCIYFPPAQKSFYVMNTQLSWSSNTCMFGAGKFSRSYIIGDPCTSTCNSFGNTALIQQNATKNQEAWGLSLANVHDISAVAADRFDADFYCNGCTYSDFHDLQFLAGRAGVQIQPANSLSTGIATNVRIYNTLCSGMTDVCLNANGSGVFPNKNIQILNNFSTGLIYTILDGAGHDYNLEDSSQVLVSGNQAIEAADTTQPNESCFQTNANHATNGLFDNVFKGNTCVISNPSLGHTLSCFQIGVTTSSNTYTNVLIEGNTCNGGSEGVAVLTLAAANQLFNVQIKGNDFSNCGWITNNGCIYVTGVAGDQDLTIEGNSVQGVGSSVASPGILVNNTYTVKVTDNRVHNAGKAGIELDGIRKSTINHNISYNNSQQSSGTYAGIVCSASTNPCQQNTISNNLVFDDQGSQTQQYGIYLSTNSAAANNKLSGNAFGPGNKAANLNDNMLTVGSAACNYYESTIGCDHENATINSLAAVTLVPTGFNPSGSTVSLLVTIASECTAVAGSTLQWQVNYSGLNGSINQQSAAHACTSAGQFTDTFAIRSTGATAVTYQAIVASAPAFRDNATVQLQ